MIFIQTHKDISPMSVWIHTNTEIFHLMYDISYNHTLKIFHLMYDIHTNTESIYHLMYDIHTNTQISCQYISPNVWYPYKHKDISPNVWYSYKHTKIFHLMYDIHTNTQRYFT